MYVRGVVPFILPENDEDSEGMSRSLLRRLVLLLLLKLVLIFVSAGRRWVKM